MDSEVDSKAWASIMDISPFKSPFQTQAFYNFINSVNGYKAKVYAIEENGYLTALCLLTYQKEKGLKGFFSRRAIIYGGPVFTTPRSAEYLLKHMALDFKNAIYIEVRNLNDYSLYKEIFQKYGFNYESYLNYKIDISKMDVAMLKFSGEKRRQIKKALTAGVLTKVATTQKEVESLYNILKELYSVRVKKPLPDLSYFVKLFEQFEQIKNGFICLVIFNNEIIGGAFCPFVDKTVYDWYRCGLDIKHKALYPSTLSVYAAMSIANEKGLKQFDFMGAGKPDTPYGVRDFKSQFGGELVEHGRFVKINKPLLYSLGKTALNILSRIKKN